MNKLQWKPVEASGGIATQEVIDGVEYKIHAFMDVGEDNFKITSSGTD